MTDMREQRVPDDSWGEWPLGTPAECAEEKSKAEKPKEPKERPTIDGQLGQTSSKPVSIGGPLIKPGNLGQ